MSLQKESVVSREKAKIRERFPVYMALPAPRVTTLAPDAVVSQIINVLQRNPFTF